MYTYQELTIQGPEYQLKEFLALIRETKLKSFSYSRAQSNRYADMLFVERDRAVCFRAKTKELYKSSIWLLLDNNKISSVNIIPFLKSHLTMEEYNYIISSFYKEIYDIGRSAGIEAELSASYIDIKDLLSSELYSYLDKWESNCNRDGGVNHPCDYERWMAFVVESFKKNSVLKREDLEKWLLEDRKWGDVRAVQVQRIGMLYEYGLDLMRRIANGL